MADINGNRFATMLHKNTHKLVLLLVYALLEWVLIALLLTNSLFTYLITKFASFFGLQKPCLWCSSLDHVLDSKPNTILRYSDRLCDAHAAEISLLRYCPAHRSLAPARDMCWDCSASSAPGCEEPEKSGLARCCCCGGERFRPRFGCCDNAGSFGSGELLEEDCLSSSSMFICYEKEAMEDSKAGSVDIARRGSNGSGEFGGLVVSDGSIVQCRSEEEDLVESVECDSRACRLIPVELIDSSTRADKGEFCSDFGVGVALEKSTNVEMVRDFGDRSCVGESEEKKQDLESKGSERVFTTEELYALQINVKKAVMTKLNDLPGMEIEEEEEEGEEEEKKLLRTQGADCEADDKDCSALNGDGSETFKALDLAQNGLGPNHAENATERAEETTSFDAKRMLPEATEQKEDKFPDTPTSTSLTSEKRESGAKESMDGSVASELEGVDAISTIEQLKTALKSERKALGILYAELEEERSASAIAANQTMAMITRLQEEKAAMQMEALQYQRMMEEQSEYDQEALQLLNDLMIKREKEKQELERELEGCRKKILDYEEKEKMRTIRRIRDGSVRSRNSSASCSHACDSDDLSIDLNRELRDDECGFYGRQERSDNDNDNDNDNNDDTVMNLEEIAMDCVKNMSILDESLTEFEEERLSILDQLKALEEKLVQLGDEDGEFAQDLKQIASASQPDGEDLEESLAVESVSRSFPDENDNNERKLLGSMAKKLLPFLDAADSEMEEGFGDGESSPLSRPEVDSNKVAIEEEVDHVYERLQALEADREFLKNCMSSIKKGDKGMDLLQEILQHLRDLRTIELRMKNTNDEALGEVAVN